MIPMLVKYLRKLCCSLKTEHKLASEESYKMLVAEVEDYAIYMLDPKGTIVTWNKGAESIKGYSAEEIIGKHFSIFFPPEDLAAGKPEMELQTAISKGRFEEEGWRIRKDGSRYLASVIITPLYKDESLYGFVKITKDLTQRSKISNLEEMDRQRNEFLAMLAHELRNPLAPVRTTIHIIKEKYAHLLDNEFLDMNAMINRQLEHMSRMIDDLLDVARITHGKIKLDLQPVRVSKAIEGVLVVLSSLGLLDRHKISIECPKDIIVKADPTRLEQIITNLVGNAIKYTDDGKEISITVKKGEDDYAHVVVSDQGHGISPAALPHIFDLFFQSDQSIARSSGGLGLGLTIVKKLMDLHGGTIGVKTVLGTGTSFDLGFHMANQDKADRGTAGANFGKRILIVEDNKDAAHSLSLLFSLDRHDVRVCHDGNTAVVLANLFDPDVVILDIGLPGISGFDVARALRASTVTEGVKIVAVSGYSREHDLQQAKAVGINEYLPKPADPEKLRRLVIDSA
jgi:PAS domain S-box-containing protein